MERLLELLEKNKGIEAYSLSIQKENLGITYTSCNINGKWQADVSDGQMSEQQGRRNI